jgi:NAD(P)-dependent dehydrogenase (short-subunit alcohol dehydrogenase family)
MSTDVSGRIALVTGGARGLGVEICRKLAELDAHVIVAARDLSNAEKVAEALRSDGHQTSSLKLDVTSEEDRRAAYERIAHDFGRLDILINNAAVLLDGPDASSPVSRKPSAALPAEVRQTFEVNFFGPLFLTQTLLPLLQHSDAPRVVNVSSIRGSLTHLSDPTSPVYPGHLLGYDTSKAALNAATILFAEELRGTAIKINTIHPGWLQTTMGGGGADMSVAEGAETVVKYATLGADGPTGGFFFQDERLPW